MRTHLDELSATPLQLCTDVQEMFGINSTGPRWFDDTTGDVLDPARVAEGMEKERQPLDDFGVFREIDDTSEEAKQCRVIGSRWVLVDRGETVKARLVLQEVNTSRPMGACAVMPSSAESLL